MDVQTSTRVVLLGKTGSGKSSLGNTILKKEVFPINHSSNSEKSICCTETECVAGKCITLIETPGFFDTCSSEELFKHGTVRCLTECAPGPHAFLIVLKVERYTVHEKDVICKILQCFSEEAFKFAAIVFTHGDQLPDGMRIEEFIRQNEALGDLVKKCGGRCHVVDNKYWKNNGGDNYRNNKLQVALLLNTINRIIHENKGGFYTNEMFQEVTRELKKEEDSIRKTASGEMSQKDIQTKAKSNVFERLLITLASTAAGVLMGAILGVADMVRSTLTSCQGLSSFSVCAVVSAAQMGAVRGAMAGYQTSGENPQEAVRKVWDGLVNQSDPGPR